MLNSKVRDSSSKIIFDDNILCSQFLRDYIDVPCLRGVRPEDIEDVSEQYVPLFEEERNADRVKKVHVRGEAPFFLVSLIEHKTEVDNNVSMQIFRYMIHIWDAFEKEAEKQQPGVARRADFKYPPILPIIYYEGSGKWTVPLRFSERIMQGDALGEYLPEFKYYLVPLRDYSNEELLARKDEISLIMLINKLQTKEDEEKFRRLPIDEMDTILKNAPGHIVDIIAKVLMAFLLKENVPLEEAEELVDKVKEKKMAELFGNMEKMDIQAERRRTAEQRVRAEQAEDRVEQAEERAEQAERKLDAALRTLIENYQELELPKDSVIQKLMNKFEMDGQECLQVVEKYWVYK